MAREIPKSHEQTPEVREYLREIGMPLPHHDILASGNPTAWRWYFVRSVGVCGWIGTDRADVPVRLRKLFREVYDGEPPPAASKAKVSDKARKVQQVSDKQSEISMEPNE